MLMEDPPTASGAENFCFVLFYFFLNLVLKKDNIFDV